MPPTLHKAPVQESLPLPTRETIADGVMLMKENPIWLPKADKYRLYKAVQEIIASGHKDDTVLAALGMSRQQYYGSIWFTNDQAAKFEEQLKAEEELQRQQEKNMNHVNSTSSEPKILTAREKIALVDAVYRIRYEENMMIDDACKKVGITRSRFNHLDRIRDLLSKKLSQKDLKERIESREKSERATARQEARRERESAKEAARQERLDARNQRRQQKENEQQERRRQRSERAHSSSSQRKDSFIEAHQLSPEQRKEILDAVYTDILQGMAVSKAARKNGIYAKTYYEWAADAGMEVKIKENPAELMQRIKNGEGNAADLRNKFIEHFIPFAQRRAAIYAQEAIRAGVNLDEAQLISVGLYEGVELKIDSYDLSRGTQISAYFQQFICLRMLDEMRKLDWVPRTERKKIANYRKLQSRFNKHVGRMPFNEQEVRDFFEIGDDVELITSVPIISSADAEFNNYNGNLYDVIPEDNHNHETFQIQEHLRDEIFKKCDPDQQRILQGYYIDGKTMKEIGHEMELSESRISQMHTQLIKRLKEVFGVLEDASSPSRNTATERMESISA